MGNFRCCHFSCQCLLLLFYFWCEFLIYTSDVDVPHCPQIAKILQAHGWIFFTRWNFVMQQAYLTCSVLAQIQSSNALAFLKDFLFISAIYPGTFYITAFFWTVYAYDREMIFPKSMDSCLPFYLNHAMHTLPAVLVLVELFAEKVQPVDKTVASMGTLLYGSAYISMLLHVRFTHGRWAYPFFAFMSWPAIAGFLFVSLVVAALTTRTFYVAGAIARPKGKPQA